MNKICLLLILGVTLNGCSTLKRSMWDCYGCIGSMKDYTKESPMVQFETRMSHWSEQVEKDIGPTEADPSDIWYTLNLHKSSAHWGK